MICFRQQIWNEWKNRKHKTFKRLFCSLPLTVVKDAWMHYLNHMTVRGNVAKMETKLTLAHVPVVPVKRAIGKLFALLRYERYNFKNFSFLLNYLVDESD